LPIFGAGTRGAASHSRASEEAFGGGAGAHTPALPKHQPTALGGGGGGGGGGLEHRGRAARSSGAPSGIGGGGDAGEDEIEDCVEGGAGGGREGGGGGPSASPAVRSSDGGCTDLSNDPSLSFPTMGSRTGS